MVRISVLWAAVAAAALFAMSPALAADKKATGERSGKMAIKLESPAFAEAGMIPSRYTGDGEDVSPFLKWSGAPAGTKSFALIVEDPDAPGGLWVHWVVCDIPSDAKELPENASSAHKLPKGASEGMNDFHKTKYGGPCPPSGTHRYYFRLYALDALLGLKPGATRKQVMDAMKGHVLAEGELMGKYTRRR